MAEISKTRLRIGIAGMILSALFYTLINYMDSREIRPDTNLSYSQIINKHPSRLSAVPNDISDVVNETEDSVKEPPLGEFISDVNTLTIVNPTTDGLADFFNYYKKNRDDSGDIKGHTYNVLSRDANGMPVWSNDPNSNVLTVNGYGDNVRKPGSKLTDSEIEQILKGYSKSIESNFLYGALKNPDGSDYKHKEGTDYLFQVIRQQRGTDISFNTVVALYLKGMGKEGGKVIENISLETLKVNGVPQSRLKIEGNEKTYYFMATSKGLSPELAQMVSNDNKK